MRPPCEVVSQYLLPAFRSLVAKKLIKEYNFSQVETAKKLGTTQASISHYIYSKRGDKRMKQLESIPLIQSTVKEIARGIATEKISHTDSISIFCKLCATLRNQGVICNLHRDSLFSLPDVCRICLEILKAR